MELLGSKKASCLKNKTSVQYFSKFALTVPSVRIRNLGYLLDEGKE